jgi:nicotinate dehydrogenase subunit B
MMAVIRAWVTVNLDEVTQMAGTDPVQFRLRYLADERASGHRGAAERADWQPTTRPRGDGQGRGFAFAQYKNRQVYVAQSLT